VEATREERKTLKEAADRWQKNVGCSELLGDQSSGKSEHLSPYSTLGINLWSMAVAGHWSCFESTMVNRLLHKVGHQELHKQSPEIVPSKLVYCSLFQGTSTIYATKMANTLVSIKH
jgi:hypothetical protein